MQIKNSKGSATANGHEGSSEVNNYNVRNFRTITKNAGGGRGRSVGANDRSTIFLTKKIDSATPSILNHFYQATNIPEVVFKHVTADANIQPYLVNTFKDIQVASYEEFATRDGVMEEIELSFMTQEKRFTPMGADNKPGSSSSVGYDFAAMQMS
jgi:type VI protein secretion system component Hcp